MNQFATDVSKLVVHDGESAYERDLVLWFEAQVALLRARQFDKLDLEHLIEELDAMPGRDRRELKSRLRVLLAHLLKCRVQPEMKSTSWYGTIRTQRLAIHDLLEQSPSLKQSLKPYTEGAFASAVALACNDTGLDRAAIPESNPYSIENILDEDFIP